MKTWDKITHSRVLAVAGAIVLLGVLAVVLTPPLFARAASYTGFPSFDFNALATEIQALQSRVSFLENRAAALESKVQTLQSASPIQIPTYPTYYPPNPPTNVGGSGSVSPSGAVVIDQNGGRFVADGELFFTGRGFAPYEPVLISSGGVLVRQVSANASGNIASAGVRLAAGRQVFVFTGQSSGISTVASVEGVRSLLP